MDLLAPFRRQRIDFLSATLAPESFDGLASPWSEGESELTRVTLAEQFPGAAIPIGRRQAMTVAAIAAGRHVITGRPSHWPLVHMHGEKRAERQSSFVRQPEIGRARSVSVTWWLDSILFHGRCWLLVVDRFAEDGRPRKVRWVPEAQAQVDSKGELLRAFGEAVNAFDVIRIDGPHEGILNFGAPRIREALDISAASARAAKNPVPSVELHQTGGTPLTDPQIDKLTERWATARNGQNGNVAFTNQHVEAKMHGQAPEQLLLGGRNLAAVDAARMMGIPAWAVDAVVEGASMTYQNAQSRTRELIDGGLQPYMDAITDRLSLDDVLGEGHWVRFDTSLSLAPDFKDRMEGYKIAKETGVYTDDELRALERGVPLEEKATTA